MYCHHLIVKDWKVYASCYQLINRSTFFFSFNQTNNQNLMIKRTRLYCVSRGSRWREVYPPYAAVLLKPAEILGFRMFKKPKFLMPVRRVPCGRELCLHWQSGWYLGWRSYVTLSLSLSLSLSSGQWNKWWGENGEKYLRVRVFLFIQTARQSQLPC